MDLGGIAQEESEEKTREFFQNPDYIHYVGMLYPPRPGVRLCVVRLEFECYQPGTFRENLFFLRIKKWQDIIWTIVSIPKSEAFLMEEMVVECGLRISDGVPTVISAAGCETFPFANDNIFTLENAKNHPVYKNDPKILDTLLKKEAEEVKKILNKKQTIH